jgi:hypothetical protein
MRTIGRWLSAAVDRADHLLTVARLCVLDRLVPLEESPVDRAIARKIPACGGLLEPAR